MKIFDFNDYKAYLLWREQNWDSRGMRQSLAKAMGCQPTHVSQILNGTERDFSPEQAVGAQELLGHSELEADYFLNLVNLARAGNETLKSHYLKQLSRAKRDYLEISNRISAGQTLSEQDQAQYYSHPYFALIHMALTIPELQTVDALAERLKIAPESISQILNFLIQCGLAVPEDDRYKVGKNRIHLNRKTHLILNHHRNWRNKILEELIWSTEQDLHYTSVMTLSKADFKKIREKLSQCIEQITKEIVPPSPEEEIAVLAVDFFTYKK